MGGWAGLVGGWLAILLEIITNSAQAEARARAELGKNSSKMDGQ